MSQGGAILKTEFTKRFKSKSGIILILLFILVSVGCIFVKPTLETENSYYDREKGFVEDRREPNVIANEKFHNKIKNLEMMKMDDKLKKIEYKEYKDITFWQVFNHKIAHPLIILFMLGFIATLFCTIYTDEIISGVDQLILSSRNKYKVLNSKLIVTFISTLGIYITYLAIQFIGTYMKYGAPKNGDLQAFRIFDLGFLLKGTISIHQYIGLKIAIIILVLITFAFMATMFSFLTTNSIASIGALGAVAVLSKFITVLRFVPQEVRFIFKNINFYDLLFSSQEFVGLNLGEIKVFGASLDVYNLSLGLIVVTLIAVVILIKVRIKRLTV